MMKNISLQVVALKEIIKVKIKLLIIRNILKKHMLKNYKLKHNTKNLLEINQLS